MKALLALISCLALFCAGCKSPEAAAYKSIATITTTVDTAMNAWGDYVRAGLAKDGEHNQVRAVYQKYQRAVAVARSAVIAAKTAPDGQAEYQTAISALSASSGEIVALINTFTGKEIK